MTSTLNLCNNASAMVPIHYFLALIAILVSLMGCTQRAPLGSTQNSTAKNTTALVETRNTPEPKQTLHHGGDNHIKPSNGGEPVAFTLESPNAGEWKLNFASVDSEILYRLLETAPAKLKKDHLLMLIKNGVDLSCMRTKVTHSCSISFNSSTGELQKQVQSEELVQIGADLVLNEKIVSPYFEFDPLSVGKFGRLAVLGNDAKKIYEALSITAVPLNDRQDRFGKKGKNVACYQEILGTDPTPSYACRFFFDYDTGTFDEIKVLN